MLECEMSQKRKFGVSFIVALLYGTFAKYVGVSYYLICIDAVSILAYKCRRLRKRHS